MVKLVRLISAKQIKAEKSGDSWSLPTSIEWMPAGSHNIDAWVNGYPGSLTVTTSEADVAGLDAQLQARLQASESGKASRPFIDFDHRGERAAGIPKKFFWENGIRCEIDWTAAGKAALEGREYAYFSPEAYLDDGGHPVGIAATGPIGGLVNTPAFQTIQKLSASQAEQPKENMNMLLKALVAAGLIPSAGLDDETAAGMVADRLKAMSSENASKLAEALKAKGDAEAENKALVAKIAAQEKASAEAVVSAAVAAGKIKDDVAIRAHWVKSMLAAPTETKAMLDAIPETRAKVPPPGGAPPVGTEVTARGGARIDYTERALRANQVPEDRWANIRVQIRVSAAQATISTLWTPAVWMDAMREGQALSPALVASGCVARRAELDVAASGGGTSINIPLVKDITEQDDEIQVETTAPTTTNGITAGQQVAPILNRVTMNSTTALASQVSGLDVVAEMSNNLFTRRQKQRDKTAIAVLRGITGGAGTLTNTAALAAMRLDLASETGASPTAEKCISVGAIIQAKALLGELSETLSNGAMFVHSNILAALEIIDANGFKQGTPSGQPYTIRTFRGIPIYVSDRLVRSGTTSGYVYETYLIAQGVFGLGEKPQQGDTLDVASLQLELSRSLNDGLIYDRTRFILHPRGMKWTGTPSGQSATNTELATITNWELVGTSAARSGIVCIRTNG